MELEKLRRQLRLMSLLARPTGISVAEVCEQTSLNRRSVYRYLEAFRQVGFKVCKEGTRYRLDHASPFFRAITDRIHFTEAEAMTINQVLNSVYDHSPQVRHLREKLASLYDARLLVRHGVDAHLARNLSRLYTAAREERMVVLRGYASAHSGQTSDRVVEPYLFLAENTEVRCYEVATGANKTFKIARAADVELLDTLWDHKEQHAPFFTDLFHFTGDVRLPIRLALGRLATSVLLEEYPAAENQLTLRSDGRHELATEVCSYKGVGRFVLGLLDDIEVLHSPDFSDYLRQRLRDLTEKFGM